MLKVDLNQLNPLEQSIYAKLNDVIKENGKIRIIDAANICNVSPSKISKFVNKMGFSNFKAYVSFFTDSTKPIDSDDTKSQEFNKIVHFLEEYDHNVTKQFVDLVDKYNRIIIVGYGPTFMIAEYFSYKLRMITDKPVIHSQEESFVENITTSNTLVIVFSVTGRYKSFVKFFDKIKEKGGSIVLVVEEYNESVFSENHTTIFLTKHKPETNIEPYYKTRTILLIFVEQVIKELMDQKKE